jgi:hypothetical protein
MKTYTPFTIIRGVIIMAFIWPAMIPLGIHSWRIKNGYAQRTPIDGGMAAVTTMMSIPLSIVIYAGLAIWWFYGDEISKQLA